MAHDERAQSDRAGPDQSKRATTGHPVQDAIAQRWSPYGFAPRELPAAELRSLLEAARWSASSYNEQPWRFLVARREEGEAFERLVSCLVEFNQSWARHASALLLGVVARDFEGRDKRNPAAEHDLGLATGNLMTEATTRGIAVHAMIGIEADVARERCAIPPGFDPLTAIAIGYAGEPADFPDKLRERDAAPRERKGLTEIAFGGSWGEAAACLDN